MKNTTAKRGGVSFFYKKVLTFSVRYDKITFDI